MSKANTFEAIKAEQLVTLAQYVPIVDRVHGDHHPEFHEIRRVFEIIQEKIRSAGDEKPQIDDEIINLREISKNYTVPSDVCETYEAVYVMLSELDEAYHA